MRRPIIIVMLVAIVLILGSLVYLAFSRNGNSLLGSETSGTLPDAGTQAFPGETSTTTALGPSSTKFGALGSNRVAAYYVTPENLAFLVEADGRIAQVENGQATVLSSVPVTDLRSAAFSSDGRKVLVTFGAAANPQASVFSTDTKTWQPVLFSGASTEPQWIPGTHDVLYAANDRATAALRVLRLAITQPNARPTEVLTTTAYNLRPVWDGAASLLLADPGSAATDGLLLQYSTQTKQFLPILQDVPGLSILWSPASHRGLLFRSAEGRAGGSLSIVDANGETVRSLSFATLPEKCAFTTAGVFSGYTGESLVCAVPTDTDAFQRSQLPDAWHKRSLLTTDTFYAVRMDNGALKPIDTPLSFSFDAEQVSVANGKVFFRNRYDGRVYGVGVE